MAIWRYMISMTTTTGTINIIHNLWLHCRVCLLSSIWLLYKNNIDIRQ